MSDPNVIRSFLISLGFSIDESGFKKFEAGVKEATKVVAELGAATTAAAAAVEVAVVKVSSQFENLYYASQRLHSTVENIRATDYAISQVGGTADGARQSLEGLASFIRSNPAGEGFIKSLGVTTRDANGELRDTSLILGGLGKRFAAMPYYLAKVRASVMGIDELTLQALIRGTDEATARYHAMARAVGVDQQAAAEAGKNFMRSVRDLQAFILLSLDKLLLRLQGPGMTALVRLGEMAIKVFNAIFALTARAVEWFGKLDKATGGVSTAVAALLLVLGPLLLLLDPIVVLVGALGLAIVGLIDDFESWKEGSGSFIDWKTWSDEIDNVIGALGDLGDAFSDLMSTLVPLGAALAKSLGPTIMAELKADAFILEHAFRAVADSIRAVTDLLHGDFKGAAIETAKMLVDSAKVGWGVARAISDPVVVAYEQALGKKQPEVAPTGDSATNRKRAQAAYAASHGGATTTSAPFVPGQVGHFGEVVDFFKRAGFSATSAQGVAAGAGAESRLDPNAHNNIRGGHWGIGQWGLARQADFQRMFGHPIQGSSLNEQLQFMLAELTGGGQNGQAGRAVQAATSASAALAAYITKFERPAQGSETSGDMARGLALLAANSNVGANQSATLGGAGSSTAVTINQRTDIKVDGATDPRATAKAVGSEQGAVNGDLVRNTKAAIR